jgi:hypothetical protein
VLAPRVVGIYELVGAQVARHHQEAEERIAISIQVAEDGVLVHRLLDLPASQERFHLLLNAEPCIDEELADQGVACGVDPVGTGPFLGIVEIA